MVNQRRIRWAFYAAIFCAVVMLFEDIGEAIGVAWIDEWDELHVWEVLVIGCLLFAVIILGVEVKRMERYQTSLEDRVNNARAAFGEMLDGYVKEWGLTATEREITLLLLKGCSIAEISEIRNTAQGTVKSQTNAIYKKSGLGNKTQLLSIFIEDLTGGESVMEH